MGRQGSVSMFRGLLLRSVFGLFIIEVCFTLHKTRNDGCFLVGLILPIKPVAMRQDEHLGK